MKKDNEMKIMVVLLVIVLLAVLIASIFFVSYNEKERKNQEQNLVNELSDTHYHANEEETQKSNELKNIIKEKLPVIDGGISTVSLEAGIKANLLDKTIEEVETQISHTSEEKAFSNLLAGKCDLIFTTTLTENQEREAASKNVDIRKEIIANEALVFVVNSANPIESLTQEQLQDIFSGKITNWKDVGGNNAKIEVYQNPEGTMAQKLMENFMDGIALTKAKTEFLPTTNFGIVEAISTYDNSENAIGFMVYKYPSNMYGNGNEIKFLKIDGIEATKQSMSEQRYLWLYDIYAVYNNAKVSEKTTDELVEWLLTLDGQKAVSEAGYIPIKNVEAKEQTINKYGSLGTGKEQAEDKKLGDFYYTVNENAYTEKEQDKIVGITGLKNEELKMAINKFINEKRIELQKKEKEYDNYLSKTANSVKEGINVQTECKNGYLCVQVLLTYKIGTVSYIYDGYSTVFNLYTGQNLLLSDLYYLNADFEDVINEQIENCIIARQGKDINDVEMKRPFIGITNNIIYGFDMVAFKKDNPYFVEGEIFNIDTYFENISVVNEERDMKDNWESNIKVEKTVVSHETSSGILKRGEVFSKVIDNCLYNVFYISTNNEKQDKEINKKINKYIDNSKIQKLMQTVISQNPNTNFIVNSKKQYQITISVNVLGNKYAIMNVVANQKPNEIILGYSITDLETGEAAKQEDIQKWKTENGVK